MKKVLLAVMVILVLCWVPGFAQEKFPSKPIYMLVGHSAGGSTDIVARTFEPFFNKELKVPVVVQNQPGAGADIANNNIWKAKPDGYTLGMTVTPSYTVRELIKKPKFKMLEMTYIYGVAGGDYNALCVAYDSPLKSFDDVKKKAASQTLSVGGTTPGSNSWYAYIMLRETTGIKFKYVPYNSGTEAALAAAGGHVDLAVTSVISLVQPAKTKQIRILAGFDSKRDPMFPDLPMMVDFGYKDLHFNTFQGVIGPPRMAKEIVSVLADAAAKAVKDPKFKEIADKQGFTLDPMSGPDFHNLTAKMADQARKLLTQAGEIK
jgi:tripartite-type tricarboxylate transporter receptor subunit TctC